jgi:hypothetical protein
MAEATGTPTPRRPVSSSIRRRSLRVASTARDTVRTRAAELASQSRRARGLFHRHIRLNSSRVKAPRVRTPARSRMSAAVGGCSSHTSSPRSRASRVA